MALSFSLVDCRGEVETELETEGFHSHEMVTVKKFSFSS